MLVSASRLLFSACAIQLSAFVLACLGLFAYQNMGGQSFLLNQLIALIFVSQALLAVSLSCLFKQPTWWRWIHGLFPLAIWLALQSGLPTWVYGAFFILLFLIYGSTARTRVPLYLSNATTCEALAKIIPSDSRIADLGSGTGTVLSQLATLRPDCTLIGYETAWIPYLISCWRNRGLKTVQTYRRSFWHEDLTQFNVLYSFLSPQPMPALWDKLKQNPAQQTRWLISNSFPVPDIKPQQHLQLDDARRTQLYQYEI